MHFCKTLFSVVVFLIYWLLQHRRLLVKLSVYYILYKKMETFVTFFLDKPFFIVFSLQITVLQYLSSCVNGSRCRCWNRLMIGLMLLFITAFQCLLELATETFSNEIYRGGNYSEQKKSVDYCLQKTPTQMIPPEQFEICSQAYTVENVYK